jgi:hypothetical protein
MTWLVGFRLRLCTLADDLGNVSAACRVMGVDRSTSYRWKAKVDRCGLEAFNIRERRRPRMPNQIGPTSSNASSRSSSSTPATAQAHQRRTRRREVGRHPDLRARRVTCPVPHRVQLDCFVGRPGGHQRDRLAVDGDRRRLRLCWAGLHSTGADRRRRRQARARGARRHTTTITDATGAGRKTVGWDFEHRAIDDASRLAYAEVLGDEKAATAVGFLRRSLRFFAGYGIETERVITDNGSAYVSAIHAIACRALAIRHLRTRARRPQTNRKAERFHPHHARRLGPRRDLRIQPRTHRGP